MYFLSLCFFHLKVFSKNKYFVTTMILSTVSLVLMQYIIANSSDNLGDQTIWLRAAIFGMWATVVTSAGAIGFQKFQGTLVYLFNNKISDHISLIALIIPCSLFGLLAFPLSYILCAILGISVPSISLGIIFPILSLFTGALSYTLVISSLFVMTRAGVVYEQLISVPILLVSGVFSLGEIGNSLLEASSYVNPITAPIMYLMGTNDKYIIQSFISQLLWLCIAYILFSKILKVGRQTGKFGEL